jgi:hypothetical protein
MSHFEEQTSGLWVVDKILFLAWLFSTPEQPQMHVNSPKSPGMGKQHANCSFRWVNQPELIL